MRMQTRIPLFAGMVIFLLLIAACSPEENSQSEEVANPGLELPSDIEFTIYQGETFQEGQVIALSEVLSDGKPLVLNFYAGLCPPCRLEMPDFQKVYEAYKDRVVLFGLDVGPFTGLGSREDGQALLRELVITYPAGTTLNSEVIRSYQILGMPTTFFITPEGKMVEKWTGILTENKMSELIEELLSASSNSP